MADTLPGWQWEPGQWAKLPDGQSVLVEVLVGDLPAVQRGTDRIFLPGAVPDPDGAGMGEHALQQVPAWSCGHVRDEARGLNQWMVSAWMGKPPGLGEFAESRTETGPTLYTACEAIARARGGWGR